MIGWCRMQSIVGCAWSCVEPVGVQAFVPRSPSGQNGRATLREVGRSLLPPMHPHHRPACCVTRGRPFPLLLPSAWGAHTTACAREQRDRIPTHTNLLGNRIQSIGTALVQIPMCTPHALWTCGGVHAPVRAPPTRRAHAPARWPAPQHARGTLWHVQMCTSRESARWIL